MKPHFKLSNLHPQWEIIAIITYRKKGVTFPASALADCSLSQSKWELASLYRSTDMHVLNIHNLKCHLKMISFLNCLSSHMWDLILKEDLYANLPLMFEKKHAFHYYLLHTSAIMWYGVNETIDVLAWPKIIPIMEDWSRMHIKKHKRLRGFTGIFSAFIQRFVGCTGNISVLHWCPGVIWFVMMEMNRSVTKYCQS